MAVVVLPTPLQARAGGAERVPVEGATAGEALRSLEARCPELLAAEHLPKVTSVQAS